MIKLASALVLFSTLNGLYAMENIVTLPSQQELKKRLSVDLGIPHFVETTYIDRKLGSQKAHPLEVTAILDSSLQQYTDNMENNLLSQTTQNKRQDMIAAILQEHPEAIQYIKATEETATKKKTI